MGNCFKVDSEEGSLMSVFPDLRWMHKVDFIVANWVRMTLQNVSSNDLMPLIYEYAKYEWFEEIALKILNIDVLNEKKMKQYQANKVDVECECEYISQDIIIKLCQQALTLFTTEPALLNLNIANDQKLIIFGSIRGDLKSLLQHFDAIRVSNNKDDNLNHKYLNIIQKIQKYNDIYLFLGDYVCRGQYSTECIVLLYCLKVIFPNNIILLRGRYEDASMNRLYGFYDDLKKSFWNCKYGRIWKNFTESFNMMPFIAVVNNKWFCVHSGISREMMGNRLNDVSDLNIMIQKPIEIPMIGLVCDLLYSAPMGSEGWGQRDRIGAEVLFGPDIVAQFLDKHHLQMIIRGSEIVEDGFEWMMTGLMSIFSSENYCNEFENDGAIMIVDHDLNFKINCINDPKIYVSEN